MKICYLADARSAHIQRWAKYFTKRAHKVHLISIGPNEGYNFEGVNVHFLKNFSPQIRIVSPVINLLFSVIQIRKLIKRINPDILHAYYITDYGFLGALSGFHPFVVRAMGSDILINPKEHRYMRVLTKYVLRKADSINCHGERLIEKIVELGADREKIEIVGLGVEMEKFKPLSNDKRKYKKEELGLSNSPVVISTRKFKPKYDVVTLIRAIPLVLEKIPDAKFIIAGSPETDEDYLKEVAKSLGVSDSIRFVGWIDHEELPDYLASANIYVSTSLTDAGPVSTLEAMACELPVVVTDAGEHRNWIDDGVNGFIVPIKSTEVLASKIVYLLENEEERHKMGKVNRPKAEQIACDEREIEKMERLYKELIAQIIAKQKRS